VVRNLGVMLDTTLSLEQHIKKTTRNAFYHLKVISKARRFLSIKHTSMLINALALSRIDFCASLLYEISKKQQVTLQRILKYGVRLTYKLNRNENWADCVTKHGWLTPISKATFRIATLTFIALHSDNSPPLRHLVSRTNCAAHNLRSDDTLTLNRMRTKTAVGDKMFAATAPRVWNNIPSSIRKKTSLSAFKEALHSHLLLTQNTIQ
jgi:hypothetical protein